jgi:hypothetical protein
LLLLGAALINDIFAQAASNDACSSTLDYLNCNYVLPMGCSNNQTACPPPSPGILVVCPVNLLAWGYSDTSLVGYINVNGTTLVNTTRNPSNIDMGFNIAVLNPVTCTASGLVIYSPLYVPSDATALVKYLQGLATGTVIIGVTADTATDVYNQNLAPAIPALQQIGITTAQNLNVYRSKLAFVAQIGNPSATVFQLMGAGGAGVQLNVNVQGWQVPPTPPVTFTKTN